ncbi:MAG: hypothetical protein ACO3AR_07610 [Bacteroidia bacterium]
MHQVATHGQGSHITPVKGKGHTMDTVDISMADTTIDTAEDEQKIEKM